ERLWTAPTWVVAPAPRGTLPPTAVPAPTPIRISRAAVGILPRAGMVGRAMWRNPPSPPAPVTRHGMAAPATAAPDLDYSGFYAGIGWCDLLTQRHSVRDNRHR